MCAVQVLVDSALNRATFDWSVAEEQGGGYVRTNKIQLFPLRIHIISAAVSLSENAQEMRAQPLLHVGLLLKIGFKMVRR